MITRDQALGLDRFHVLRPGHSCEIWRRNGQSQTWVTMPGRFRTPVKWGLHGYGQLTEEGLHVRGQFVTHQMHIDADCPNRAGSPVDRADPVVFG